MPTIVAAFRRVEALFKLNAFFRVRSAPCEAEKVRLLLFISRLPKINGVLLVTVTSLINLKLLLQELTYRYQHLYYL